MDMLALFIPVSLKDVWSDAAGSLTSSQMTWMIPAAVLTAQCQRVPNNHHAVFSGGRTALLLSPGTGVCKPTRDRRAARYRRMAAAVDEAAQTIPTVSPFDPAVREDAIVLPRTQTPDCHMYHAVCGTVPLTTLAVVH